MCNLGSDHFWLELFDNDNFIPVLAIFMGCLTGMVAIVAGMVGTIVRTRARESTRRELAAYVAEGTIKPEDAVAIINAGRPKWEINGPGDVVKKS